MVVAAASMAVAVEVSTAAAVIAGDLVVVVSVEEVAFMAAEVFVAVAALIVEDLPVAASAGEVLFAAEVDSGVT